MQPAPELTARPIPGPDDAPPVSEIVRDGAPTGRHVRGAVLEGALRCGGRYLVFLTDDVPYEESLNIHLLDEALRPVDSVTLGWPYGTGVFSDLRPVGPDRAAFRFLGDADWSVAVLPRPGWRLPFPFGSDPAGVWRRPGLRRHLVVRRDGPSG